MFVSTELQANELVVSILYQISMVGFLNPIDDFYNNPILLGNKSHKDCYYTLHCVMISKEKFSNIFNEDS